MIQNVCYTLASQRRKYPYQWDHLLPAIGKEVRKLSVTVVVTNIPLPLRNLDVIL